ncbi:MAG: sulfatase [Methylococcaceae bacterium]|nr:sulfatase [Methylococcaceae bacterium]
MIFGARPSRAIRVTPKRQTIVSTVLAASIGWCSSTTQADIPPATVPRMNVLFIVADDLNSRMNVSGFPAVRTPNLDELAKRSVNFANTYAQFPVCGPSRASFLTGKRPDTIKIYDLVTRFRDVAPGVVTLPQHFKKNGYFSGRVGKIFHQGVPGEIGKDGLDDPESWDIAINPKGRDKMAESNGKLINMTPDRGLGGAFSYLADEGTDEEQTDGMVATEAIKLLQKNRKDRFFIAVGFYRPHTPEIAPKKYFDMYPLDQIQYTPEDQRHLDSILPAAATHSGYPNRKLSLEQQRTFIRAYYASTTFMDAQVGRVLTALKDLGLENNTIVVFTSDNGYALGEHGQWQKDMLFEPVAKVPLLISVPGKTTKPAVSRKLVEMLDIYPTLADIANLPVPAGTEGHSLRPLIENPELPNWNYPAHSQVVGGRSVRVDRWRYTEWEQGARGIELYDELNDPGERTNLAKDPGYRAIIGGLKPLLPTAPVGSR